MLLEKQKELKGTGDSLGETLNWSFNQDAEKWVNWTI